VKWKGTTKNEVLLSQKQASTKLKNVREDSSDEEE